MCAAETSIVSRRYRFTNKNARGRSNGVFQHLRTGPLRLCIWDSEADVFTFFCHSFILIRMRDDETLKRENPDLYRIAREKGTEPPFTGRYVDAKNDGMYHCAVCNAPLFSSDTKFDSGSGWPSFTDPAFKKAVTLHEDASHSMTRTEVRCAKCDAHLGHVFNDGPVKGGKVCDRYCVNSISLELKPYD